MPAAAAARPQKSVLFFSESSRVICQAGRAAASAAPGKPAPDPTSITKNGEGRPAAAASRIGRKSKESSRWRRRAVGRSRTAGGEGERVGERKGKKVHNRTHTWRRPTTPTTHPSSSCWCWPPARRPGRPLPWRALLRRRSGAAVMLTTTAPPFRPLRPRSRPQSRHDDGAVSCAGARRRLRPLPAAPPRARRPRRARRAGAPGAWIVCVSVCLSPSHRRGGRHTPPPPAAVREQNAQGKSEREGRTKNKTAHTLFDGLTLSPLSPPVAPRAFPLFYPHARHWTHRPHAGGRSGARPPHTRAPRHRRARRRQGRAPAAGGQPGGVRRGDWATDSEGRGPGGVRGRGE